MGKPAPSTAGLATTDGHVQEANREILRIANAYPQFFTPFLTVNPRTVQEPTSLNRLLELGGKGFEIYFGDFMRQPFAPSDQTLASIYEFCERNHIPVCFHLDLSRDQLEFERILSAFPKLKGMCSLFTSAGAACDQMQDLMDRHPSLYVAICIDGGNPAARLADPNLGKLRALVLSCQDRVLFGTNLGISTNRNETVERLSSAIRAHRDLLERSTHVSSDTSQVAGLNLDVRVLLKIYARNAERFLATRFLNDKHSSPPWYQDFTRRRRSVRERQNWSQMQDFIGKALASSRRVDENFLFSLNRLALDGFADQRATRGRYRARAVVVRRMGNAMFIPPRPKQVPALMKQFIEAINTSNDCSDVEFVARLFLRFQQIHPFWDGNGRTGRALATFLLRQKGFREKKRQSLELFFDSNAEDCYDTLYQSKDGDPLPWILYFTAAVESTMLDLTSSERNVFSVSTIALNTIRQIARLFLPHLGRTTIPDSESSVTDGCLQPRLGTGRRFSKDA